MTTPRRLVSRNAAYVAAALVAVHLLTHAYVVDQRILYDQGGFEGLLWWLVAFLVLPVVALLTLISSAIAQWLKRKNPAGE
ncbi:hypothetical protein [Sphingopyxis sp. KK2]|uniref:hypothetical protein n=1 Tax=Sphingopyxis sp. KK2 TaxID=1855727 RepID=UPI0011819239|nr:hypothetical protein [Sphingopyxis sp. KK2]